jgi:hypothetical protein
MIILIKLIKQINISLISSFKLLIYVSEFKFQIIKKFNYQKANVLTIMKN